MDFAIDGLCMPGARQQPEHWRDHDRRAAIEDGRTMRALYITQTARQARPEPRRHWAGYLPRAAARYTEVDGVIGC